MPNGLNSGSCKQLVDYLSKEKGFFFDNTNEKASNEKVQEDIDKNIKSLKKGEDRFYMVSFSPSQSELQQMVGRKVTDIKELTYEEKTKLYSDLREFTHNGMDIYAKNFNRENVNSRDDLVYFARIETERTYNYTDKEVINGEKKRGENKEGLHFHIHVIVSRKSADGKVKLSPNTKFRGNKWERKDTQQKVTRGFDYKNFTQSCSQKFTKQFNITTRNNHTKGVSNANAGLNKATNKVKGEITKHINELLGDNLKVERQILSKTQQGVAIIKNIANVAAATNPASATKALVDLSVKAAKAIHSAAAGL